MHESARRRRSRTGSAIPARADIIGNAYAFDKISWQFVERIRVADDIGSGWNGRTSLTSRRRLALLHIEEAAGEVKRAKGSESNDATATSRAIGIKVRNGI